MRKWMLGGFLLFSMVALFFVISAQAADTTTVCEKDMAAGKALLENRCNACHVAPKPGEHSLTEWPGILNRMGPRANLRKSEMEVLSKYITATLKKKSS